MRDSATDFFKRLYSLYGIGQSDMKPRRVRCMYGDAARGGSAVVHWVDDARDARVFGPTGTTVDLIAADQPVRVFVAAATDSYRVESYSPAGRRIQFCGHGALAAAWVVFDRLSGDDSPEVLRFVSAQQQWQARRDGEAITLVYERPALSDCPVPGFAEAALGVQPVAAAEAGGADGYLILELSDAVREVRPDFAALTTATSRAIIVTARAGDGISYRYFAPQYGTPEDSATGSAAVQLAAYWSARLSKTQFNARQLSAAGACLLLGCHGDVIELTARVRYR